MNNAVVVFFLNICMQDEMKGRNHWVTATNKSKYLKMFCQICLVEVSLQKKLTVVTGKLIGCKLIEVGIGIVLFQ